MRIKSILFLFALTLASCSGTKKLAVKEPELKDNNTFLITEISDDDQYALTPKKPVEVGGGPVNERRYLNALCGPNGEQVSYYREGSCCPVKSDKALFGDVVMLDRYMVSWEGGADTIAVYINMYDVGNLKAPKGFGIKK